MKNRTPKQPRSKWNAPAEFHDFIDAIVESIDNSHLSWLDDEDQVKKLKSRRRETWRSGSARYRKDNPKLIRMRSQVTHLRSWAGETDTSSADIEVMLKMQKDKCWWCSLKLGKDYQVDHRIPLAKGGSNNLGNLCLACRKCNHDKKDKMPWEFNGRLL